MLDKSVPLIRVLMVKTDTENYPRFYLPEGFSFTGYKPGYEKIWADIIFRTGQIDTLKKAEEVFEKEFLSMPDLLPKQCLFVLNAEGEAVATTSLWHGNHFGRLLPRIHWVGTVPEYNGKGLAKALMTKVLDVNYELGNKDCIYLTSQTWSYKALNMYMKFGFKPYKGEKPVNWEMDNYDELNKMAWDLIERKFNEYKKDVFFRF